VNSRSELTGLLERAASRAADQTRVIEQAVAVRAEAERELRLLLELAEVWGWTDEERAPYALDADGTASAVPESSSRGRRDPSARAAVVEAVIEILATAEAPLRIGELMTAVEARGVAIPGSGRQANLIGAISQDPRIERTERGVYALSTAEAAR
jgi:hypothetical protein